MCPSRPDGVEGLAPWNYFVCFVVEKFWELRSTVSGACDSRRCWGCSVQGRQPGPTGRQGESPVDTSTLLREPRRPVTAWDPRSPCVGTRPEAQGRRRGSRGRANRPSVTSSLRPRVRVRSPTFIQCCREQGGGGETCPPCVAGSTRLPFLGDSPQPPGSSPRPHRAAWGAAVAAAGGSAGAAERGPQHLWAPAQAQGRFSERISLPHGCG